ncbi:hypothetical protein [Streptomyces olivochromogenes]|uniref:hypothetical protein n=1 Tax=Streptomyces olivochromogenes TaxID=1963 RepID=UPI001F3C1A09|nr:hypothetical protein [Streptomyces olivochromogenes]
MPVRHGDEYTGFVVDCYGLDEDAGRRFYDSAFFSRPKGCDKSGLGARLALFEALGPARFDGWAEGGEVFRDPWGLGFEYVYEPGEPMGRPVSVPYIRIMATEEGQTGNVYDTVYFNLTDEASPPRRSAALPTARRPDWRSPAAQNPGRSASTLTRSASSTSCAPWRRDLTSARESRGRVTTWMK